MTVNERKLKMTVKTKLDITKKHKLQKMNEN